ncbi:hypothetical protein F4804DRAFT_64566 [Jackrogersella minutella]|nr:hypothetical protein F4804DRAFT_64566 [Jackrogersella minutella]
MVERPPSATTSRVSMTGNRDFNMKFIAPPAQELSANSVSELDSHPHTPAPAPALALDPPPALALDPEPGLEPEPMAHQVRTTNEPPSYWDRSLEAGGLKHESDQESDEDYAGCHPFWMGWLDILRGMGLIFAGAFKIPLVLGHGIAKTLHFIPTLYNDDSVRKWPKITGFPSACAASFKVLWWGFLDGMTDWCVLPYKTAKKEGWTGFFKGFARGLASFLFKPVAGIVGFACHPFFGIYKEAAKFKFDVKRERRSKQKVASLT